MGFEVIEKAEVQPPALTLTAARATGLPDETAIPWTVLWDAEVGQEWQAIGGGSLYSASESATVVWRDETRVVLLVSTFYRDAQRDEETHQLKAFVL